MKKEYKQSEENETSKASEPTPEYGIHREDTLRAFYDIPNEFLSQRIAKAEKDIAEGNVISLEDARRRILK